MPEFSLPEHFDLSDHFDHRTLTQAMLLEPQKAVVSQHIDAEFLLTQLRIGTQIFEQTISFFIDPRTGLHLRGLCTCHTGFNCKHVGAALMAFEAKALREARAGTPKPASSAPTAPSAKAPTVAAPKPLRPIVSAPAGLGMPGALDAWLKEVAKASEPSPPDKPERKLSSRCLMYVLSCQGMRLALHFHIGQVRKGGLVGSHRPHSTSPMEMLRTQPVYLSSEDESVLAALLPFAVEGWGPGTQLFGPTAAATLVQLTRTGKAWLNHETPSTDGASNAAQPAPALLRSPASEPLKWKAETLSVRLHWQADAQGHWRTQWVTTLADGSDQAVTLLSLPQLHAFDPQTLCLQPATLKGLKLPLQVLEALTQMPPVPSDVLPDFVRQLGGLGLSRGVMIPLPPAHTHPVEDLGALPLKAVLRLLTCPNVPSEMWLEGHQRPPPAGQPLRQAAAQLVFRYQVPSSTAGGRKIDFNFPAGMIDDVFIEPEASSSGPLLKFSRDTAQEVAVIDHVFKSLQLRPWSRLAGWALERLSALKTGLLHSGQLPRPLQEGQLIVVPMGRDQWPRLLSEFFPMLQEQGWDIERDDDFPYEMYQADDFEINLGDAPGEGQQWFSVGLKVTVAGQPVDLVPLLVGLVQGGWLSLDSALSDPQGEILLPWPIDEKTATTPRTTTLRRERLLRLPVSRVAPMVAWLRGIFMQQGPNFAGGLPRLSRFEMGAFETFAAGLRVNAPPSLNDLMEQLRQLRTGEGLPRVAVSARVNAELRPYQCDGLTWMDFLRRAKFGGILADDMGLGKTLQALSLLQGELDAGRLTLPSLVVVPTSLLGNWQAEAQRFTPDLKVIVLHGKQRGQHFANIAKTHLVVTSYPLAVRDIAILTAQPWHYLILDEAQRIKNSRSQAALVLKSLQSQHRLCLSGTPIENHLGELWSLMDFVSPGLLGQEAQFREHYRVPIEKRKDTLQADNLAKRVRPFILRRTKNEVARELPEKTETLLRVELDGAQRDLYETVRATMDTKLRDAIAEQGLARNHIVVLDALLKLRQVCCDPRLLKNNLPQGPTELTASAKLELLMDLLPTLVEDGRRILVFSQFTEMLALIETELQSLQLKYLKLTGETIDRASMVSEFQNGDTPIFLISLKAGGVGLNLTAADTVILYDPWWNPAVEQQAIDRAYRIGQGKPVFVYKLVANGTVEEKMLEMQARKAGLADALLSGVASDASLTAQDFEELFKPLGNPAH